MVAYNARSEAEVDRIFADLDGHHWEVAFNPFWTIGADGGVSLHPPK